MLPLPAGTQTSADAAARVYVRHRPERSLLYQIFEEYYPAFVSHLVAQGTVLLGYVQREFEEYLKCGRLEHGFLRVRCDSCHAEQLVAFSCRRRGFCPSCGARRMADDCRDAGGRAKHEPEPRVRPCWRMKSFPSSLCANGC